MGAWGAKPWENDTACDWYDQLFEVTHLAQYIDATLTLDIAENADEIRAAAHVVLALGEHNIWPMEHRVRQIETAAGQLQRILDTDVYRNSVLVSEVRREIKMLLARIGTGR